jgi:hypothetical protein
MENQKAGVKNQVASAKQRAQAITDSAKEQYKVEVERLKLFNARWNSYVNKIIKEYPCDQTRKLVVVSQKITEILMRDETFEYTPKDKIEDVYTLIDGEDIVTTEKRPSLYGESESGFNMEDVLNPKENLDLKTLLQELGVTD